MANDFSGDSNCQALYNFESGTETTDSTGNGNTLTDNNTVGTSATAKQGSQSADFTSGANESYSIDDGDLSSNFPFKNGDSNKKISVCLWFQIDAAIGSSSERTLIAKTDPTLNKKCFRLSLLRNFAGNDYVRLRLGYNSGADSQTIDMLDLGSAFFATATWFHIGFTYDDGDKGWYCKLYKEGDTSYENSGTATNNINIEDGGFSIGAFFDNGSVSGTYDWDGLLDEVVVFNDELSEAEIDSIMAGTYGAGAGAAYPYHIFNQ